MKNSVFLEIISIDDLHSLEDFHEIPALWGRFNAYDKESELEPRDITG